MAAWLYESCSSAPESAKFKFKLANEVAVLESAKFELSNHKKVALNQPNFTTCKVERYVLTVIMKIKKIIIIII